MAKYIFDDVLIKTLVSLQLLAKVCYTIFVLCSTFTAICNSIHLSVYLKNHVKRAAYQLLDSPNYSHKCCNAINFTFHKLREPEMLEQMDDNSENVWYSL